MGGSRLGEGDDMVGLTIVVGEEERVGRKDRDMAGWGGRWRDIPKGRGGRGGRGFPGLGKVDLGKAGLNGSGEDGTLGLEDICNRIVASNDESFGSNGEGASLNLCKEGVTVGPDLEVVSKEVVIEIVQKDRLLVDVAVPPFVLQLQIGVGVLIASTARLTSSGRTPEP